MQIGTGTVCTKQICIGIGSIWKKIGSGAVATMRKEIEGGTISAIWYTLKHQTRRGTSTAAWIKIGTGAASTAWVRVIRTCVGSVQI